jgi:hypothetical protein
MCVLGGSLGLAQVMVLTANGSNDRTNANLQETKLAPANVIPGSFGKLGSLPVDGQVYAQPLYVSDLMIPGRGVLNVLFVATMHNSVYAYNADAMAPPDLLWRVNLGPSVPSTMLYADYSDIDPEIGILGGGAIDLQRGVLYVVSETLQRGVPTFLLHALDLTSGAECLNGPAEIAAAASSAGAGVVFDPLQHLQRPGLLLANDAVYIGFGSHADQNLWHGWLMSYDAANVARQIGVFLATRSGWGGAIWQSGRGPAADDQGNVYIVTGNGDYDGLENFSESFLRLTGAAPTPADWFTPANWAVLTDDDADLSAGPALIPGTHLVIGADKNGNLYLVNGDDMGQMSVGDFSAQSFSVSQGFIFNFALWSRPGNPYLYVQGEGDALACYELAGGRFNTTPVSVAAATVDGSRVGMTVSANGGQDDTGILWETTGDYDNPSTPGTLHAFDASNLASELWNSDMLPDQDFLGSPVKFVSPTVANGKVYVPTLSGTVAVYGLLLGE